MTELRLPIEEVVDSERKGSTAPGFRAAADARSGCSAAVTRTSDDVFGAEERNAHRAVADALPEERH
jgi:hypothetical protein